MKCIVKELFATTCATYGFAKSGALLTSMQINEIQKRGRSLVLHMRASLQRMHIAHAGRSEGDMLFWGRRNG